MSDHNHYQTFENSLTLLPWLLLVLALEFSAGFFNNELVIGAHSFDVLSDVLAFLIVMFGSVASGLLDDHGRPHRQTHREQRLIAVVNLLTLWVGVVIVLVRSGLSFGQEAERTDLQNWWVILGPLIAVGVYWRIEKRLHQLEPSDLTIQSLRIHVKGDVFVSILAVGLTFLSLIVTTNWINPVGGIIMAAVLFTISWELRKKIFGKNES